MLFLHSTFTAVQLALERVRNSGSQVGMHEQFWHNSKCGARFLCFGVADKVARFIAWAYDWGANSGDLLEILRYAVLYRHNQHDEFAWRHQGFFWNPIDVVATNQHLVAHCLPCLLRKGVVRNCAK